MEEINIDALTAIDLKCITNTITSNKRLISKYKSLKEIMIGIYLPSQLLLWSQFQGNVLSVFIMICIVIFGILLHKINAKIFEVEMQIENNKKYLEVVNKSKG